MKRFFLLSVLCTLFACSGDDSSSTSSQLKFNPPNWIKGTWLLDVQGTSLGYHFDDDDFCLANYNVNTCYKETLNDFKEAGGAADITEDIISDNRYKFSFNYGGSNVYYDFVKVSTSKITITQNGTTLTYLKQ